MTVPLSPVGLKSKKRSIDLYLSPEFELNNDFVLLHCLFDRLQMLKEAAS